MSIVEDDVEQRAVDLQPAVVLDEAQLAELVHEEADARAGRADHLRQRFLADLGDDGFRPTPPLAELKRLLVYLAAIACWIARSAWSWAR